MEGRKRKAEDERVLDIIAPRAQYEEKKEPPGQVSLHVTKHDLKKVDASVLCMYSIFFASFMMNDSPVWMGAPRFAPFEDIYQIFCKTTRLANGAESDPPVREVREVIQRFNYRTQKAGSLVSVRYGPGFEEPRMFVQMNAREAAVMYENLVHPVRDNWDALAYLHRFMEQEMSRLN